MEILNLGNILDGAHEEGTHAWYRAVLPNLGIKIFKVANQNKALSEYLITKFIEPSGFTTNIYAMSWVKIKSPYCSKMLIRPALWMEHVKGYTAREILDNIIYEHCPTRIIRGSAEVKTAWAYDSEHFAAIRLNIERNIVALENGYGVTCQDHYLNMSNFILQDSGLIKVIDFSKDTPYSNGVVISKEVKPVLMAQNVVTILPEFFNYKVINLLGS
jgi:hypothetical protein